jgi:hypothetical protein
VSHKKAGAGKLGTSECQVTGLSCTEDRQDLPTQCTQQVECDGLVRRIGQCTGVPSVVGWQLGRDASWKTNQRQPPQPQALIKSSMRGTEDAASCATGKSSLFEQN